MKITLNKSISAIVITGQLMLLSCGKKNDSNVSDQTNIQDYLPTVQVVHPAKRIITSEISMTGTLKPNQEVKLYAMVSGFIKSIHTEIGDLVTKGELIAELENPELSKQFEVHKANNELKNI